jgi:G:T-mismatch repair DNA endonuclease (very short patch repair protein)
MAGPIERLDLFRELDTKQIERKDPVKEFRRLEEMDLKDRKVADESSVVIPVPATRPEAMVWWMLDKLNVPFLFQYDYPDSLYTEAVENYRPDFMLPDYKILIEVYGSYWHMVPGQIKSDRLKEAIYMMDGWKVCIWWDWEIEDGVFKLFVRDLYELLASRPIRGGAAPYPRDVEADKQATRATKANNAIKLRSIVGAEIYKNPWMKRRKEPREFERKWRNFYKRPREQRLNSREFESLIPYKDIKPAIRFTQKGIWESKAWSDMEK